MDVKEREKKIDPDNIWYRVRMKMEKKLLDPKNKNL